MKFSNVCYGILVFLLWQTNGWGIQEFLYPVGIINHEEKEKICVLYQKSAHLELWFWDPDSLEAVKSLLSSFTPAGLRVLPNQKAFSFIDNDRIRVKDLNKRSPRTIDLSYGPYDFSTIEWINSTSFYFSAREREHLNLFHGTIEGELYHLTRSTKRDYMYPQKQGDSLFYVTKHQDKICTIDKVEYPIAGIQKTLIQFKKKNFKEQLKLILEEESSLDKTYLNFTTQQRVYQLQDPTKDIAFLSMRNEKEGYFLTHPSTVSRNDLHMAFECYHLYITRNDQWKAQKLFSFKIPLHLLMPQHNKEERLYESMLPLLPLFADDGLYYSHDSGMGLNVYKYAPDTETSTQLTNLQGIHHFFSPLFFKGKIYYGGTVSHDDGASHDACPHMWLNEEGMQRFIFPIL